MEQLNSGESKFIFRNISRIVIIGLTTSGRKPWQEEEETRKDTSIVLIRQEQQNYSEQFLPVHLSCRMCNQFTFHHQFGIDTWRSKFEQQTDSILSACGSHGQKHKDPDTVDLNAPCHAQYMHKAWQKHQTRCIGSTSILLRRKD